MNLQIDLREPLQKTVGSLQPSHLWVLDRPVDHDGTLVGPGGPQPSYWAECECPDDCPRDHENE
jgi:hypothetical protein